MTKVTGFLHGIYPRSGDLAQMSRDFDRKRVSEDELEKQRRLDFEELVRLEKEEKFAYIEDGKLRWQDVFRPIVEATEGMEVGALTRWFDNNNFFKQPVVTGELSLEETRLDGFFVNPGGTHWKVTLPSPFLFAKVVEDRFFDSFEESMEEVTNLLKQVVVYLEKKGVVFVQFNEPYIPYYGANKRELSLLRKFLGQIKQGSSITIGVHFYFGDAAPVVKVLAEDRVVDVVGIDFYKTSLSDLPKKLPVDVIAGVIDGRNSLLEDVEEVNRFVDKAVAYLQPKVLYLSSNSDMELLPESVAREKIRLLGVLSNQEL